LILPYAQPASPILECLGNLSMNIFIGHI
jgi:hypothetical protein